MPKSRPPKTKVTIQKVDAGSPCDFRHVQQVKWDPDKGYEVNVSDENIRKFFEKFGGYKIQEGQDSQDALQDTVEGNPIQNDIDDFSSFNFSENQVHPYGSPANPELPPPLRANGNGDEQEIRKSSGSIQLTQSLPSAGGINTGQTEPVSNVHAVEAIPTTITLRATGAPTKSKPTFRTTLAIEQLTLAQNPDIKEFKRRVSFIVEGKSVFWQKLKDSIHRRSLLKRTVWNANPLISMDDAKILQHTDNLSNVIAKEIIGKFSTFNGPFGIRTCLYVDTTASGKPLAMIEDFIQNQVLPFYANTHTEISHTSHVTSSYRFEAREIVREAVGADEDDAVIFYGSGSTGVVNKLVHALSVEKVPLERKPVVLIGPYEHHSNLLPWRESGALVINVSGDANGCFDISALETVLREVAANPEYKQRPIYGSFSAGSNVTGTVVDDIKVTMMMHQYGGLCFWDYAAAAPHVQIVMNPIIGSKEESKLARKDAIFFSGHKFSGGPQTTGILVAKKHVFKNKVPHGVGGGTISFVTSEKHAYVRNREEAEEGGTPGILQSIRLGLVFSLHESIGIENVISREAYFTRKAIDVWSRIPGITILGNMYRPRLPIVSFLIEHLESGFFLHYSYVVALLNDLFGIQCRGGCMCAGPYAIKLLGIQPDIVKKYEGATSEDVSKGCSGGNDNSEEPASLVILRPGFARVSFSFDLSDAEVDFVIEAVKIIARDGWRLLPLYCMDPLTGSFTHYSKISKAVKDVTSLRGITSKLTNTIAEPSITVSTSRDFSNVLQDAINTMKSTINANEGTNLKSPLELKAISSELRWFMVSSDTFSYLNNLEDASMTKPKCQRLFTPPKSLEIPFQNSERALTRSYTLHSIPYQLTRSAI